MMTEQEFEIYIDGLISESTDMGYHPTRFIEKRRRLGTIKTISDLVQSGEFQAGFREMTRRNRLDLTIEHAVTKAPNLFTSTDLECANFRLVQARNGTL
jgi:hypothetical protein